MDIVSQVKRARGRGASLVAIVTQDQPAASKAVALACNGEFPCVGWDLIRGPYSLNGQAGQSAVDALCQAAGCESPSDLNDLPTVLTVALTGLPPRAAIVVMNAHRFLTDDPSGLRSIQAILNVRDVFSERTKGNNLFLLCPSWPAPIELGSDVLVIDDTLPDEDERAVMARKVLGAAQEAAIKAGGVAFDDVEGVVAETVRMTRGLSRYAAQRTMALSVEKTGLDREALRARFVAAVNACPGLSFEPDPVDIADVGGLEAFKAEAEAIRASKAAPQAVVFVDEIEKALAGSVGGSSGDSGVSSRIVGALLTFMNDTGASGFIAVGPNGSGKSMSAKALGAVLGVPTIRLDPGAFMTGLVGGSEANVRKALATLKALAPRTLWVATCNSLREDALPPELLRRFSLGIWMFDLPDEAERAAIWNVWRRRLDIPASDVTPSSEGWSGANIQTCCRLASERGLPLATVAKRNVIPCGVQARKQVESLRRAASGQWLSASHEGVYRPPVEKVAESEVAFDFGN